MAKKKLSAQIRAAVDASSMSRYRICQEIGITQGAMSKFMAGKISLSLETLDRLCDLLGLELKARKRKRRA